MAAVEDLLFRSKISETAAQLGVEALFPRSPKKLLDEALKSVPVVGFLSHVQKDLALAARESGCDRIMARSAFTKDLPEILSGAPGGNGA